MSIDLAIAEHVAVLKLSRPDRMNAVDSVMRTELRNAWTTIAADDAVRAVVVTGAGDRSFSAGVDLKEQVAVDSPAGSMFGQQAISPLTAGMEMDKPIIAAVNGVALGGGFELALACDIRLASQNATFGLTEVKVGSIPGAGGTQRLPRLVGRSDAMIMLLTGRSISAVEAFRIGLVSGIYAQDRLLEEALSLAGEISSCAPLSVRAVKRLVRAGDGLPLDAALQLERLAFSVIRTSEDRLEGRAAFREKRKPNFKGK
jgi:E-phenylitaconyl-CoA hydratase